MTTVYSAPAIIGLDQVLDLELTIQGQRVPVYNTPAADYASVACDGSVEVTLRLQQPIVGEVVVRPLSADISVQVSGSTMTFTVDRPRHLRLEIPGRRGLYLFVHVPEQDLPQPGPRVRHFAPGYIHEVGVLELTAGETLVIPAGAVVRGQIHAADADGIRIRGQGILLGRGSRSAGLPLRGQSLLFERCRDLRIDGLCVIGTASWTLHLSQCEDVDIGDFTCIGWVVSSDGIDVVASRRVHVHDCLLHNNDDCIAVKGLLRTDKDGRKNTGDLSVRNVVIERCVMWNDQAGNAMEVGFETRDSEVDGVIFRDIDVIGAHGEGAVFSIHNGDRSPVRHVLWENIRVEHFYDRFIDIRSLDSRWTSTPERGVIEDVTFRDITCIADVFNTPSLIGGWDAEHPVCRVRFENLVMGGKRILTADALQLFTRHAEDITFI